MSTDKFLFTIYLVLFFSLVQNAQEAYKIDETSYLRCDLSEMGNIDVFVFEMQEKTADGLIIVYGIKGKATRYANEVKKWAIERRGQNPENVSAYYGGYSKERRMELWIIPKGSNKPKTNTVSKENESTKFDEYFYVKIGEFCDDERPPALNLFAKELKSNPNYRGYILVYGKNRNNGLKDKKLMTKLGIEPSRITVSFVERAEQSNAELWIVPKGANPPKPILPTKSLSKANKN